ncbi:unnamed protein product [Staurois parvus]|uniref:Uncharacterized protein n=1 Tax=Staurois parvus TaxID=386267 RepID=A0ABN9FM86_9NEOB|nr:unnamed protein product [Staurois parvus]
MESRDGARRWVGGGTKGWCSEVGRGWKSRDGARRWVGGGTKGWCSEVGRGWNQGMVLGGG